MRPFVLLFAGLCLFSLLGCDGGGDGDGEALPSDMGVAGDHAAEGDDQNGTEKTWVYLSDAKVDVPPGSYPICSVEPPGAGTLHADYGWDAPPEKLGLWLKQTSGGTGESGYFTISSPAAITTHVDGGGWSAYVNNNSSASVEVRVYILFLPD